MADGEKINNTDRHSVLFNEWHVTKNGNLILDELLPGSDKRVWWVCEKKHEWQTSVANRVKGNGCPFCSNRKVLPGYNDLQTTNPGLAKEWHVERNEGLTPCQVMQGTKKLVWWKCAEGHEWQAAIVDRNQGNGCPYCANKKVKAGYNDLKTTDPDLALEWHPFSNGNLLPTMVTRGSHKKVWWQCAKGHEWQAVIKSRATGIGCPYCSNKRVLPGYNDLTTTNPAIAAQWHPTKNGKLQPDMVTAGCNQKVWWQCTRGHEWTTTVSSRAQGAGCPSCARKRVETGENDLCTLASGLADEWHPTKNDKLKPDKVSIGSNRKVWWICGKGHEWKSSAKDRIKGQGCPFCSNKQVKNGYNDLLSRYPELASEWNTEKNDDLLPDQVVYGSHKIVWWKCKKGHVWRAAVVNRVQGSNCPYCSNKRIQAGENDLQTIDPKLAEEWHPNKNSTVIPSQVSCGSNKKVWWRCKWNHEWQATVVSRVQGNGCPECAKTRKISFPEKAIVYYLKAIFPDLLENANKTILPWIGKMEIDIYIPSLKLGVEYDGPQHILATDQRKNELCFQHGVRLIRIRDDRLPNDPEGSVNIRHNNQDDGSLEKAIAEILKIISAMYSISANTDIDINRDRIRIMCLLGIHIRNHSVTCLSPETAAEWNYEKNNGLKPENFTAGSNQKVWWKCDMGHAWRASIVARQGGTGCPYCSNKKVLSGYNDLASQNPALASQWHPVLNNNLKPTDITPHSGKKVWWKCEKGHVWQATADCRARGHNCPYCANRRALCGYNDLASQNPALASQWHPSKNGELKASDVTLHSNRMVWWQCEQGHEWKAHVNNRAKGVGCPICYRNRINKE